jgi:hypothetical protein
MLEKVDLTNALPKEEYKKRMPKLQERLRVLQQAVFDAGVAVTIALEGWDASGKGTLVQKFLEKLDPRGFKVRPTARGSGASGSGSPPTARSRSSTARGTAASSSSASRRSSAARSCCSPIRRSTSSSARWSTTDRSS